MNTVARPDGVKEKKVEFTLSRLHPLGATSVSSAASISPAAAIPAAPIPVAAPTKVTTPAARPSDAPSWNTGPLVDLPEDEIPF
jgi:hypothetical protein